MGGPSPFATTTYWKGSRINVLKRYGEPAGLEAVCNIADHKNSKRCTRSRFFKKHGGEEKVGRLIRHWIMAGHVMCDDRNAHIKEPDPDDADLIEMDGSLSISFPLKETTLVPDG